MSENRTLRIFLGAVGSSNGSFVNSTGCGLTPAASTHCCDPVRAICPALPVRNICPNEIYKSAARRGARPTNEICRRRPRRDRTRAASPPPLAVSAPARASDDADADARRRRRSAGAGVVSIDLEFSTRRGDRPARRSPETPKRSAAAAAQPRGSHASRARAPHGDDAGLLPSTRGAPGFARRDDARAERDERVLRRVRVRAAPPPRAASLARDVVDHDLDLGVVVVDDRGRRDVAAAAAAVHAHARDLAPGVGLVGRLRDHDDRRPDRARVRHHRRRASGRGGGRGGGGRMASS
eukprot:29101-Pelagococcus_subviridis.AAC.9